MVRGSVDIRMLGGFELRDHRSQVVSLTVRKAEAVLALLALDPGRAQTRSKVCGMLWPNVPEEQARHSLRQALVSIRKQVPQAIAATSRTLALEPAHARVDAAEVLQLLSSGTRDALERVASTYTGDLLDGMVIGEEPFEQWLSLERERIRVLVTQGLSKLVELHTAADALPEALQAATRVLQLDPLHEPGLRACMRLLARTGRRAEALQQYRSFVGLLRRTLRLEPELETKQLVWELGTAKPAPSQATVLVRTAAHTSSTLAELTASSHSCLRSRELAQLQAAYAQACARGVEVCLVQGEAGVGKSHLCAQLSQLLTASDCRVLRGRCFESEQVLPFACWADLLKQARLADDTATVGTLRIEARRELARLVPELSEPPLEAADDPSAMFHALASVIAHWSQTGPLCIMLEDLHWADEMSLRFLCYAARRVRSGHGCFILTSARNEQTEAHPYLTRALAELEREGRLRHVPLAPFSYPQTRLLAEHWAAKLSLTLHGSAWIERIWTLSEGNALVVVESARALARPEVALDLSRLSVPERVRALIRRRLAALSPDARELAGIAAVYGRELHLQLFAAVMSPALLQRGLQELVDAQLVCSENERTLFTHDRVRETLYAELSPATRKLIHARIAVALTPHAAGAVLGQAGYHHAKAGNAEAAIALLSEFSEHARRSHALGEALRALDEAAQQAHALVPAQRARAVTQLAVRQAFCMLFLGRIEGMEQLLQECAELADGVDEPMLAASFHYWRGFGLMLLGHNRRAQQHAERALKFAAISGNERLHGSAHNLVSHQHFLSGQFALGGEHAERALCLLRTGHQAEPLMYAYMNVCLNRAALGELDNTLALARQAEKDAAASGSERGIAMAAITVGMVHICMHHWDLALAAAQRALGASKTPFTLGPACALLALTQLATGQAAQAAALLENMLDQLGAEQPPTHHVVLLVLHAQALLRSGAAERARVIACEAVQIARAHEHIGLGFALHAQGLAELRLDERAAARTHLEAALLYYQTLNIPLATPIALCALAELEADRTPLGAARAKARLAQAHAIYTSIEHSAGAREMSAAMRRLELDAQAWHPETT